MSEKRRNTDRILLYGLTLVVCGSILFFSLRSGSRDIGYVDISKLIDQYKLKKDLEGTNSQSLYRIKAIIDSLNMVRKISGPAPKLDSQIISADAAFKQYYVASNQDISKKVWERLNPVIEQYGKENGLQLLIGANGAGTLLYADKGRDKTDELIKYVNAKYEKGN